MAGVVPLFLLGLGKFDGRGENAVLVSVHVLDVNLAPLDRRVEMRYVRGLAVDQDVLHHGVVVGL